MKNLNIKQWSAPQSRGKYVTVVVDMELTKYLLLFDT